MALTVAGLDGTPLVRDGRTSVTINSYYFCGLPNLCRSSNTTSMRVNGGSFQLRLPLGGDNSDSWYDVRVKGPPVPQSKRGPPGR